MVQDWLDEELKTIINLAKVSRLLIELNKHELLPTQLEYMFEIIQGILDSHCIVDK